MNRIGQRPRTFQDVSQRSLLHAHVSSRGRLTFPGSHFVQEEDPLPEIVPDLQIPVQNSVTDPPRPYLPEGLFGKKGDTSQRLLLTMHTCRAEAVLPVISDHT